ncbi:MAG: hypothetical protein RIR11_4316 [Bacteroidota bacterium]|jgi:hypothetical protein
MQYLCSGVEVAAWVAARTLVGLGFAVASINA